MKFSKATFLKDFTALRFSADPETRYPLVTNLATVSIFKKPFHTISCFARNRVVSSSVEEFGIGALRKNAKSTRRSLITVCVIIHTCHMYMRVCVCVSSKYLAEMPYRLDTADEVGFNKIDLGKGFVCTGSCLSRSLGGA